MRNNINQRREYIKQLVADGKTVNYRAVAKKFNSSPAAVLNDISMVATGTTAYKKKQTTGQNTRARRLGITGTLEEKDWSESLRRHNYACANCGSQLDLCIDHVLPVSKGGNNTRDNIQPLCRVCNSKKGNRI